MSFTCEEVFKELNRPTYRRTAENGSRSAPGTTEAKVDEILNKTATSLMTRMAGGEGCPNRGRCPYDGGTAESPCTLDVEDLGRYVRVSVNKNAMKLSQRWMRDGRELLGDPDDPAEAQLLEHPANRLGGAQPGDDFTTADRRMLDRFRFLRGQAAEGEARWTEVFPGIGRRGTRYEQKLTAVEDVLSGVADDEAEALRLRDPGYYGAPEHGTDKDQNQRNRTRNDAKCVHAILQQLRDDVEGGAA